MNFVDELLKAGFEEQSYKWVKRQLPFRSTNGWFGVTTYHPDAYLKKENVDAEMVISLQGIGCRVEGLFDYPELAKKCACRYISIVIAGQRVFETFTGEMPPDEIIEQLINL